MLWDRNCSRRLTRAPGVKAHPSTRIGCDMRPLSLVASPVTGDTSSGEKSRLRGAGLLEGCSHHLQATLGDEVVLIPPGVSRTLVPLDCALVLQILYSVVVALTVRPDTSAFSRIQKGEAGSG